MSGLSLKEKESEKLDIEAIYQAGKNLIIAFFRFLKEFWESCEHDSAVAAAYRAACIAEQNALNLKIQHAMDYKNFGNSVFLCLDSLKKRLQIKELKPWEVMLPENEPRIYIENGELVFVYEAALEDSAFYKSLSDNIKPKYIPHHKARTLLMRELTKALEATSNYRFRDLEALYDDKAGFLIIVRGIRDTGVWI